MSRTPSPSNAAGTPTLHGWLSLVPLSRRVGHGERGSATLELAILTPVMILLIGFAVVAGRVAIGNASVTTIAGNAARQASLARDARTASITATSAARADLAAQGLKCSGGGTVTADVTGFAAASRGTPGQLVTVRVDCLVTFADLAIPGLPGSRSLSDQSVSPIDPNRSRSLNGAG